MKTINCLGDKLLQVVKNKVNNNSKSVLNKKLYIQSYGCAMNFSDSEIVASILKIEGNPRHKKEK